jgi:hypothetical protein
MKHLIPDDSTKVSKHVAVQITQTDCCDIYCGFVGYSKKKVKCTVVQALRLCRGRTVKCNVVQALRLCTGHTVKCTVVQVLRLCTGRTVKCTVVQALRLCTGRMVKCTVVQALRLCTGCTSYTGSRVIALPFHDHGTRRG